MALLPGWAGAETLRVATYDVELSRRGPGLMYAAILKNDPQVLAVQQVIAATHPDILLITGFDHDADLVALTAFADGIAAIGLSYPHRFALRPNTGVATGLDLDGDGELGGPGDAQGWGRFSGAGGMAVLSRYPIDAGAAQDFSAMLWRDLPGAGLPDGMTGDAEAIQRLSSTGHWDVPVVTPGGTVHLLAFAATTPVFDGPEDRNGLRNADEIGFWRAYLDGKLPWQPPTDFVILGIANLDPDKGSGRRGAIRALLSDPRLQDLTPLGFGGADTADFPEPDDPVKPGPGNLRVDYVLPAAGIKVAASGIHWPASGAPGAAVAAVASRHRLVWVDITQP